MLKYRKNKVTIYMVSEPYDISQTAIPNDKHIYTFTSKVKEAREYVSKLIYNKHYNHYSMWCKSRNINISRDSWGLYCNTIEGILDEFNSYQVVKLKLNTSSVALLFRTEYGCAPLGCSYEFPQEKILYEDSINDTSDLEKFIK